MRKVIMFETSWCPHCLRTHLILNELMQENPAYEDIRIEFIDEELHPEIAKKYDYYYVPTFYVGTDKLHEGVPSKDIVKNVLDAALAS
ncbi:thioredoxin family protein [Anaerocolumna jejuensis]|uniref:thioredoxin family protein n=1 Tax=Anaerocolumna jejuensis TaxID=259063 RepID=UPI003F7B5063